MLCRKKFILRPNRDDIETCLFTLHFAMAWQDGVFESSVTHPQQLLDARPAAGNDFLPIPIRDEVRELPVFRRCETVYGEFRRHSRAVHSPSGP